MVVFHLSSPEFLFMGLHLSCLDERQARNTCEPTDHRRFRASFGSTSLKSCEKSFTALKVTGNDAACINNPNPAYFVKKN